MVDRGSPYQELFFNEINDPSWLPLLESKGYFSNLPGIEADASGRQSYHYHLPLIALIRIAEREPHVVTSILEKLKLPDNPGIGDQVLHCIAKIRNRDCITRLRPLVAQFSESQNRANWLWIKELLKTWLELEAYADVFNILQIYLNSVVDLSSDKSAHSNEWLTNQIDEDVLKELTLK